MGLKTQITCDAPGCSSVAMQDDALGWFEMIALSLITPSGDVPSLVVSPLGVTPLFNTPGSGSKSGVQYACGHNCIMKLIEEGLVWRSQRVRAAKTQTVAKQTARVQ